MQNIFDKITNHTFDNNLAKQETRIIGKSVILDASIFFTFSFLSPCFLKVYSLNISSPDRPRHYSYVKIEFKQY